MQRLMAFRCRINRVTQTIIINTYLFSKVRYGMVIMWDLISETRKTRIRSKLRSCTKNIRQCTLQTHNDFFEYVNGYEPLGLMILQRMISIQQKMTQYYPVEKEHFDKK